MRLSLRGVSATLGAVALVGTIANGAATPAQAASGPAFIVLSGPSSVPNSNISPGQGHKPDFHPNTLNSRLTNGSCTQPTEGITITNKGNKTQTVTYNNGTPYFSLRPGQSEGVCFFVPGTYTFGLLSNKKALLTVTAA